MVNLTDDEGSIMDFSEKKTRQDVIDVNTFCQNELHREGILWVTKLLN
ncbi:MAG: hypothetical protein PHR06_04350 [Candidatus Cloacimonetes bacterium]|nr:hypothetical protein [Candidatus Cloacimonadota bacterium]